MISHPGFKIFVNITTKIYIFLRFIYSLRLFSFLNNFLLSLIYHLRSNKNIIRLTEHIIFINIFLSQVILLIRHIILFKFASLKISQILFLLPIKSIFWSIHKNFWADHAIFFPNNLVVHFLFLSHLISWKILFKFLPFCFSSGA